MKTINTYISEAFRLRDDTKLIDDDNIDLTIRDDMKLDTLITNDIHDVGIHNYYVRVKELYSVFNDYMKHYHKKTYDDIPEIFFNKFKNLYDVLLKKYEFDDTAYFSEYGECRYSYYLKPVKYYESKTENQYMIEYCNTKKYVCIYFGSIELYGSLILVKK